MKRSQVVLALVFAAGVAAFFVLDLGRYLNLAYLKSSQAWLADT